MSKCMAQLKTARQPPQRVGPDRAQWKGDDATEDVKRRRAQRLYPLDGVTCEWNSGCDASATDRHHIDGDTGNNERSNVALVCRRHHMEWDGRLARFVAMGRQHV